MTVYTNFAPTFNERDGAAYVDYTQRLVINFDDLDASKNFYHPVEPDQEVIALRLTVTEAFAGGGAEALVVGDSADADGYVIDAQLDITTLGKRLNTLHAGDEDGTSGVTTPNGYAEGKLYAALDQIKFDFNSTSALTAGQLVVLIELGGYGTGPRRDAIAHID